MFGVMLGIHILVCAGLIVVVLLQSGKGGGLAGAFGGSGGVGAVFGGQAAATFLTKATRYLAIAFMVTSLSLALVVRGVSEGGTIIQGLESRQPSAATSAGEVVTPQNMPSDLPGAESGTPAAQGEAAVEGATSPDDAGAPQGEQIPVVPQGE
ncbi:MAG: preprotein translocase subunit SecG [Candidatus Eisenbacteria bacterium]|nr:preprotein translocase subunit SecG [Candidatus Eisenbacteria bacterium]